MAERSDSRRIIVNLEESQTAQQASPRQTVSSLTSDPMASKPKKRRGILGKILLALGALLLVSGVLAAIGGYWWWSNLQKSPTYSLALLVDAARNDDHKTVEQLLDTNAVVDNFVPQVKEKANERYGRSFPPDKVKRAEQLLTQYLMPILPGVKERAKQEVPRVIKERTQSLPQVSPWIMTAGINRLVSVEENGDTAIVKGSLQNREVELTMQRVSEVERWKIIAVKEPVMADQIAEEVAQKILATLNKKNGDAKSQSKNTIEDLRKQIEDIVVTQ